MKTLVVAGFTLVGFALAHSLMGNTLLRVTQWTCTSSWGFITARGSLENHSGTTLQNLHVNLWLLTSQGNIVGKGSRPLASQVVENEKGAEFMLRFWAPRGGSARCQLWFSDPSGKVIATLVPEPMR